MRFASHSTRPSASILLQDVSRGNLPRDVHVGVDLCAPQARVPHDRLDVAEVRVVTQHVSCHRVAAMPSSA